MGRELNASKPPSPRMPEYNSGSEKEPRIVHSQLSTFILALRFGCTRKAWPLRFADAKVPSWSVDPDVHAVPCLDTNNDLFRSQGQELTTLLDI